MVSLLAADIAPEPFEPGGSGLALLGLAALVAGVVLLARLLKRPRKALASSLGGGLLLLAVGVLLVGPYLFPQRTRHGPPIPPTPYEEPSAAGSGLK
jgi:drug/metabolite transporter (DMT)-like permease